MIRLGSSGLRTIVVVGLQLLWMAGSHADPGGSKFANEVSKQAGIYKSRGVDVPAGYVVDRSLLSYWYILPGDFQRVLASLGPKDRWLDIGAGEGKAILDYSTSKYDVLLKSAMPGKARAVALSIEDRRTSQWHRIAAGLEKSQIEYLSGRRLREYSPEELGRFQLVTDVMGAFSYTRDLSLFMESTLGVLTLNGSFFTVLQDVRSESGTNRPYYEGAPFLTEIVHPDGDALKVCSWLKHIGCVEVSCELKADQSPPIEVYRVRKVCADVTVPRLELVHFEAGTPPERRFRWESGPPASLRSARTRP
jgi:hypothetical protein